MKYISLFVLVLSFQVNANVHEITDAKKFYSALQTLVKSKNKEELSNLVQYPIYASDKTEVKSPKEFIDKFDLIFVPSFVDMFTCVSAEQVKDMGWRGFMTPTGGLWLGAYYFGSEVDERTGDYDEKRWHAQLNDKAHWYYRITGINYDVAVCNYQHPNKALKQDK